MAKNQQIHKPMKEAINAEDPKSNQQKNNSSTEDNKQVPVQFADPDQGAKIARSRFISEEKSAEALSAPYLRHWFDVEPLKNFDLSKNLVKESFMKD